MVLESNVDMSIEEAYKAHRDRWKIELVFRKYKTYLELTTINKQPDYVVVGDEFVNFISNTWLARW